MISYTMIITIWLVLTSNTLAWPWSRKVNWDTVSTPVATCSGDILDPSINECNGPRRFCYLPVNLYFWLGSHNAGAISPLGCIFWERNQLHSLSKQLSYGSRILDIDLAKRYGRIHIVHGPRTFGLFENSFQEIWNWVYSASGEGQVVVVYLSDNGGGFEADELDQIIKNVCGVNCGKIHRNAKRNSTWPILGDLISRDQRIIISTSKYFQKYVNDYIDSDGVSHVGSQFLSYNWFTADSYQCGHDSYGEVLDCAHELCTTDSHPEILIQNFGVWSCDIFGRYNPRVHDVLYSEQGCELEQSGAYVSVLLNWFTTLGEDNVRNLTIEANDIQLSKARRQHRIPTDSYLDNIQISNSGSQSYKSLLFIQKLVL
ncbi:hypothetical protein K7432_016826 [Basidiobolus ranarum]|uniref:Uncharacterized protein n=1 Tax=Basidiobolus ranarum TaxID=34480 RepID=A0ABR2WE67_9FUNG